MEDQTPAPDHSQDLDALDSLIARHGHARLIQMQHERARKVAHAKMKRLQPEVRLSIADLHWDRVVAHFREPFTQEELEGQGPDHLCQTVRDCLEQRQPADALFAALRLVRWVWARQPDLGPIGQEKR